MTRMWFYLIPGRLWSSMAKSGWQPVVDISPAQSILTG